RRAGMSMDATGVFDVVLALGVLGAAVFALFGRARIHTAAMFLVFGVLLAVVWAWLEAPDVAIAEAVLGAGVTGVLIMNAVTAAPRSPDRPSAPARELPGGAPPAASGTVPAPTGRRWYALATGTLAGLVALGLLAAVWQWQ